jgi:O-antigen/teichoic acid export membrane protein
MVPIYLRYLGPEAYGLVGIFTMLQAWFQLLDLGLSPTLAREVARYRSGVLSSQQLRMLVRALEVFFYVTALLAAIALTSLSGPIAQGWLKVRELSIEQVQQAIAMMALAIPLRWISGLYRAAINGFERQILLAVLNTALATFRFVGVVAVLHWVSATPKAFFLYQLVVALIEVAGLYLLVHHMLPRPEVAPPRPGPGNLARHALDPAFLSQRLDHWWHLDRTHAG